ncbi:hypothetical protein [Marixanthomonas ophiurae]|uniref:DUF4843 domain-containing protein n=1 Tax=Marixanthomonas ophiurae TaxID=387659 RepID=A0A3E1Q963_9FLAO|nr:hypothetical protein [Marixanthomonas ophiurae]RFN58677.1 hypothetical protein DZ858_00940 [Marixanthomonas ophiurae]
MKRLNIIFAILTLAIFTVSCETNYDDYDTPREIVVGFSTPGEAFELEDGEEKTETLNIFSSEATSADRTFNVVIVESDVEPESYTFENTVTILAGEREGSIDITGFGISLTEEEKTLTLLIERANAYVSGGPAVITFTRDE